MKREKPLEVIYENMENNPFKEKSIKAQLEETNTSELKDTIDRAEQFVRTGGNWGGSMALGHMWRPILKRNREKATAEFAKRGLTPRQIAYIFGDEGWDRM
jgi:hypothetical protein